MPVSAESTTTEIYNHLLTVISSERFLKMQGLNNEIPFFICPFDAARTDSLYKEVISPLLNTLKHNGIRVLKVDLYDLSLELLRSRKIWERTLETEPDISKSEMKEFLQSVLDVEAHLTPAIGAKLKEGEYDVLFLTGVGEVFPYIRSHTVLNNLQSTAKEIPTIMFFPGEYRQSPEKGSSLNLFGRLLDDNYYRAFDIYKHF